MLYIGHRRRLVSTCKNYIEQVKAISVRLEHIEPDKLCRAGKTPIAVKTDKAQYDMKKM